MKKQYYITLISILINFILIYLFVFKGETIKSNDNRTAILMTESNKNFVLQEMRDFLKSVQKINEGILKNDPKLVIQAGEHSGGSVIAHAPKGLMKTLPANFKSLGFATHKIFDEIASSAKTNFDKNKTQDQLNHLLRNCIACHQSFKVAIKEK